MSIPCNRDPASASDPVLAAALDAVITIDADGCVIDLNPAAEQTFGYPRYEAAGRSVAELVIPAALRDRHRAGLARVLSGGPSRVLGRRVEFPARHADGSEFPVELTVTRTAEAPPRFTAWIRDLSEQKAAEAESARDKELLERAEQLAQIGSWIWTPETGEALWSDNFARIFDLEPGGLPPTLEVPLARVHPEDRQRVERSLDAARRGVELPPVQLRIGRSDGSVRHLRATGGVERQEQDTPRRLLGAVQDVTDQRRAEREVAAQLAVSEALTRWTELDEGAERLLRGLAAALDFAVGSLWLPQGALLVPRVSCSVPSCNTPGYEDATRELRLPMGIGLPGLAWERREPVEFASLSGDGHFLRRDAAAGDGLRSGLAIPALAGDEVLAVLELCSPNEVEMSERQMRLAAGIAFQLGAFFARRRGELKPPPLSGRQLEVLQLATRGLASREIAEQLMISQATVKTHFEHIYKRLGVSDRAAAVAQALRDGLIE